MRYLKLLQRDSPVEVQGQMRYKLRKCLRAGSREKIVATDSGPNSLVASRGTTNLQLWGGKSNLALVADYLFQYVFLFQSELFAQCYVQYRCKNVSCCLETPYHVQENTFVVVVTTHKVVCLLFSSSLYCLQVYIDLSWPLQSVFHLGRGI